MLIGPRSNCLKQSWWNTCGTKPEAFELNKKNAIVCILFQLFLPNCFGKKRSVHFSVKYVCLLKFQILFPWTHFFMKKLVCTLLFNHKKVSSHKHWKQAKLALLRTPNLFSDVFGLCVYTKKKIRRGFSEFLHVYVHTHTVNHRIISTSCTKLG